MIKGKGRPKSYHAADGERVSSVTEINKHGGDCGGLVGGAMKNWHEAGRLGLPYDRMAYWGTRENWGSDATEIGNIVHKWIENDIHGVPLTRFDDAGAEQLAKAANGYEAYREWRDGSNLEFVETEVPLVSEVFRYGGTIDAIAIKPNGDFVIVDWKASNSIRFPMLAQLAAYRQLLRERDELTAPRSAFLLRVGKTFGDFTYKFWNEENLDMGMRWFLAAKAICEIEKQGKTLIA